MGLEFINTAIITGNHNILYCRQEVEKPPASSAAAGGEAADTAAALAKLCAVLKSDPSELQKTLMRPGTVEFDAFLAAVSKAQVEEQQVRAAAEGQAETPRASTASQKLNNYLDTVYGSSHRGESRSPRGLASPETPAKGNRNEVFEARTHAKVPAAAMQAQYVYT